MANYDGIGIIGTGYAVPSQIRTNDDPIFDWLKQHPVPGQDLFKGYKERRVLSSGESVTELMVQAALVAIKDAGLNIGEIDALLGYDSVSEYLTPNGLAKVHQQLGLSPTTWIFPINDEYTNFNTGLLMANALVRARQVRNALVVCGCNWTRYVSYHTPQSISASDGAGAAVVGELRDPSQFTLVDAENSVYTKVYGCMYMQPDAIARDAFDFQNNPEQIYTRPYFHITPTGQQAFVEFIEKEPPRLIHRLLERHGIRGADIALITHQASTVLMDAWASAIAPAQYLQTLETFANMTLASIPVNLAYFYREIKTEYLVLLGLGTELKTAALLLKRK
ncbi:MULTISPECIES: 3-oxoacyl-[acyl-carrier-protein] synthase III C-terminal domain-containing protein [unclassified Microcoleus]|uniref:3-oxoacyl-[acyl-carrier-protein] synthase III C-terminal domain-containing protein n=1 Tax=unclassified Microcoleus TaxID=2642155 RepID=UPI002FD43EB6